MSDEMKLNVLRELTKGNVKIDNLIMEVTHFYNKSEKADKGATEVTDEQISQAIMAINGDKKPLSEKQLFIGVISVLVSKYGWVGKWATCCTRINSLPQKDMFEKPCDYNSIMALTALKFANVSYNEWEKYEPTASERFIFQKCKSVADAFDKALSSQNDFMI